MSRITEQKLVAIPFHDRSLLSRHEPIFEDGLWFILPEDNMQRLPAAVVDHADDHHAPTRAEAEAYARLFAAAPEMYEALKHLVAEIEEGGFACTWYKRAVAVLAKAVRQ